MSEGKKMTYTYSINDHDTGDFSMPCYSDYDVGCAFGAHYDDTRFFEGEIAGLEVYHKNVHTNGNFIPSNLRKLIISDQKVGKEAASSVCLSTCDTV